MGIGRGTADVVGRRTELDVLGGALANLDRGTGVAIRLRSAAGMGKTTLLDWLSTRTSRTVIRLTGSESDAQLAYSGLASLMRTLDALDVNVPEPHAEVLADAIGSGSTQGQLTVGAATLAALAAAGEKSPLLLLVDDAHWVDEPTCVVLAFALRRLHDEPIVAVVAERPGAWSAFDSAGFETIDLEALDIDDAIAILGPATHPDVAQRCLDAAEGNPLALLEIARTLDDDQLAGRSPMTSDLPVGQVLRSFVDRIKALGDEARQALAVVATAFDSSARDIHLAAKDFAGADAALAATDAAGITRQTTTSVDLTHPLMRTAIREAVGPDQIRDAHAAFARVVTDPGKRAWHLASAVTGPDESIAGALEAVAMVADRRGGWSAAAATWERAASLSPTVPQRHRRLLAAGTSRWHAADPFAAISVLDEVVSTCDDPLVRSDAIGIRSEG
ncbi:MAG TPA: AAA family ATPase, partial [Ilumatobacteraceae bacterium]